MPAKPPILFALSRPKRIAVEPADGGLAVDSGDQANSEQASIDQTSVDQANGDQASIDKARIDLANVDLANVDLANVELAMADQGVVRQGLQERQIWRRTVQQPTHTNGAWWQRHNATALQPWPCRFVVPSPLPLSVPSASAEAWGRCSRRQPSRA